MILKDAKINWPYLASPSTKFNADGVYELQAEISDSDAAALREKGINVKTDDGVNKVSLRKKAKNAKGEEMARPQVVDASLKEFSTNDIRSIGNGTVANIRLRFYDWSFNGREGTSAVLEGVQITDLVQYEGGSAEEFTAVDTTTASGSEASMY